MKKTLLCAIPARAGSKRVPGKNLLPLRGKPMIAYTIEAARESNLFEEVYVCTEDETIAAVAREHGALVPVLMPPELCGDMIPSHRPCSHLAQYLNERGEAFESLVCLQPTSPLRSAGDIRVGVELYETGVYDFVVSVTGVDPHYYHWVVVPGESPYWKLGFGERYLVERPLLPKVFRPNGSVKIARLEALAQTGHFFGPRLGAFETPEERSVHAGSALELDFCRFLLERRV